MLVSGNVVRLTASGKDGRPGVVLDVTPSGVAYVALGSTQNPGFSPDSVIVAPGTPNFKAMRLQSQTWFNPGHFDKVPAADPNVEVVMARAPKGIYQGLRKIHGFG